MAHQRQPQPPKNKPPPSAIVRALTNVYPTAGGVKPTGTLFALQAGHELEYLKKTGQVCEAPAEQRAAYLAARSAISKGKGKRTAERADPPANAKETTPRARRRTGRTR